MILLHTFPGKGPSHDTIFKCGLKEALRRQTEDREGVDDHRLVAEPLKQTMEIDDVINCLKTYISSPHIENAYIGYCNKDEGEIFDPPLILVTNKKPSQTTNSSVELKDVPKRYLGHDVLLCDEWFV